MVASFSIALIFFFGGFFCVVSVFAMAPFFFMYQLNKYLLIK